MSSSDRIRRIFLVTDTWDETNGVAKTLRATSRELIGRGCEVFVCNQSHFSTLPNAIYPELRLSIATPWKVGGLLKRFNPDAIHIATEGPIGISARIYCGFAGIPFTTSFHTRWDTFLKKLIRAPERLTWRFLRWFHGSASAVLAPTPSIASKLESQGIGRARLWKRGIEQDLFKPRAKQHAVKRPILLNVGRVSVEKNVEAFLELETDGTKYLVGDGPQLESLERRYAREASDGSIVFFGKRTGEELAAIYSEADVFVFPSLNDTFGNVILEALASGVPVAAFRAPGPVDLLTDPRLGAIGDDLAESVSTALSQSDPQYCVDYARTFTWEQATDTFESCLAKVEAS